MTIEQVRGLFQPASGLAYFDTASYGLPPRPTVNAMHNAINSWQDGSANWTTDWDRAGDSARAQFARLIGAQTDEIALVPTASVAVAPIAATLHRGDNVIIPVDEFTSVLFPFLVAGDRHDVVVHQVPFDKIAQEVESKTSLIATSLIRSQDGRMADLEAICTAAEAVGSSVLIDATHAVPFVHLQPYLDRIDYVVCHGYKHLLCPRGAAFLYARRDRWNHVPPLLANWRSADRPYQQSYGGPLTLASTAARFDVSLDWFAWVGARASLELLVEWQHRGLLQVPLDLAAMLAEQLGLAAPAASIVAVPVADAKAALGALGAAGIKAAAPGGAIRLSTHVYTTPDDINRAAAVLKPLVNPPNL